MVKAMSSWKITGKKTTQEKTNMLGLKKLQRDWQKHMELDVTHMC